MNIVPFCRPKYTKLPGWKKDIASVKTYAGLPSEAKAYLTFIESKLGIGVKYISVGPERSALIWR